jgi:hypothetical protein
MDDGNEYPYGPHRVYTADGKGGLAVSRALGDGMFGGLVSSEAEMVQVMHGALSPPPRPPIAHSNQRTSEHEMVPLEAQISALGHDI